MFDLQHIPMNFISIYRRTTLVFPESNNSVLLTVASQTKSSKILPQLFALERKAKNDPGLKVYF